MARPRRDHAVAALAGDVLAIEADLAGGGFQHAGDGAHEAGFAGAVGADDADELAGRDGEVDAAHRLDPAVGDAEAADGKQGRAHAAAPSCWVPWPK